MRRVCSCTPTAYSSWTNARICCPIISALYTAWSIRQIWSLNISREMLQHDRHLKAIAQSLEKKIKSELLKMQKDKREDYEKFWAAFGRQIKYGAYVEYGAHKELLQDLLMYHSSTEDKLVSLAEYASRMKEDQKYIYYACGETIDKIKLLPVMETLSDKGYEVLCMDDSIDEFCVKMLAKYNDKEFKSIADADLGLDSEDEKEEIKKLSEDNKDVLEALGKALEGKVKKVELTSRLKSHPCCLACRRPGNARDGEGAQPAGCCQRRSECTRRARSGAECRAPDL